MNLLEELPSTESRLVNAVIDTPQGSRNKFAYDDKVGIFKLSRVLPAGSFFPYSFGFVPRTLAEDGDPVDVLVLSDAPFPVGCVVPSRLIGILQGEQHEGGGKQHNDRLIAVASESKDQEGLRTLRDLGTTLLREIEHFFVSYHEVRGEDFRIIGRGGPAAARRALERGMAAYRTEHR